jgi:hypothetical protein
MTTEKSRFAALDLEDSVFDGAKVPVPAPVQAPATPAPVATFPFTAPKAAPVVAGPRVADKLIAVSQSDETTGAVVFWRLSGSVSAEKLETAWVAEGLDAKALPKVPSVVAALSRACKEEASKSRLVRQHPVSGWVLVDEKVDVDAQTLDYNVGVRFYLDEKSEVKMDVWEGFDFNEFSKLHDRVLRNFAKIRSEISSYDISLWLVSFMDTLKGVPLRDRGGVYFVPRQSVEMLKAAKRAFVACTNHVISEIPAVHSTESIAAILDAIRTEANDAVISMENELNVPGAFGVRAAKARSREFDTLAEKVTSYEKLLGLNLSDVQARIKSVQARLAGVGSRTNSLETY